MPLPTGTRIGQYEITAAIGAGGMGEVYRARDTRLGRDVAIKILPEHLTKDPDRVARFEREAQALAALNHPNIAQIYGIDDSGPFALVMELVDGPTLQDVIALTVPRNSSEGGIPLERAMSIARQIAEALEAAHAAAIVHRDLKPANVKVRDDGVVKVLDFGLAKAASADAAAASGAATMTSPAVTQHGVILGTAAYMAPEQARGRPVDKRADIWAFGCVLFEMLTGRVAFGGDTVTDMLAAIVTRDPDWDALPAATPRALRALLKKCLQKDPKHRLHDIADARIELESAEPESQSAPASATSQAPAALRARALTLPIIAAAVIALIVGAGAGIAWRISREVPPIEWTATRLGGPDIAFNPRISPDGHMLASIGIVNNLTQVVLMKPGTGNWTVLTHDRTHGLVNWLAWSTDSSQIYYDRFTDAPNGIYTVPNLGGEERLVVENADSPLPLADGSLLFGRINADRMWQLHRLWPSNGKIEALPFVIVNVRNTYYGFLRPLDDTHIAIVGRPLGDKSGTDRLYSLDLTSQQATQIGPDVDMALAYALAVDPTDKSILVALREGNTPRLRRFRRGETGRGESVLTFMNQPDVDVAPDGSLFIALMDRPHETLQFEVDGTNLQSLAAGLTFNDSDVPMGNAVLMTSRIGGRSRITIKTPGREPVSLVKTEEDTRAPFAPVGIDRVVVTIGTNHELAVVDRATGRIISRFTVPAGVTSVDASPEGKTIYFSAAGKVSAIPATGGAVRDIGSGDSLVVDPDSGDLIVKLDEVGAFRLARLSPHGGPPTPVAIRSTDLRLIPENLIPGAIRHGKLVLPVTTVDSWNWFPAVLDLKTGDLKRVPLKYDIDFHATAWTADGRILGTGLGMQAGLWKFERAK